MISMAKSKSLAILTALLAASCTSAAPGASLAGSSPTAAWEDLPTPPPGGPQAGPRLAPATAMPASRPSAPVAAERMPPWGTEGAKEVIDTLVTGDPTRIVYPRALLDPGQTYPALIFCHGHSKDHTQMTDETALADAAVQEGWLAAAGDFGGRALWANDRALRAVGDLIMDLVSRHQADPRRIYLVGFSMGGGTALLAAENALDLPYRVAAVASSQGFSDLKAMMSEEAGGGQFARSIADAYGGSPNAAMLLAHSALAGASRLRGIPVYLEHGEADRSVPIVHTRQFADRLTTLGMAPEVHLYPGKGHGEDTIDERRIIAFLRGRAAP